MGVRETTPIEAWQRQRFGLFVHWGPVSVQGTEIGWSRDASRKGDPNFMPKVVPVDIYDNLYTRFNPEQFDADDWVRTAQAAGMQYMVFTTKHHDGFCNFDSKLTDYKITAKASPYGLDIAKQLAQACHKAKFPLGWYYSQPDWHHADYRSPKTHARYVDYLHGQVGELLTNYGPIQTLWFDGLGGKAHDWSAEVLFKTARKLQPGVLINNRCGLPGDFVTPEQRIGGFNRDAPWETCMTLCRQWAWKPNDTLKSLRECIHTLLRTVGGDGNLLLNVGPQPDGRIEPRQVERLKELGAWIRPHADAIYGSRGGPYKPGTWGVSTCKGRSIFLFVLHWPEDGKIVLPPLGTWVKRVIYRSGAHIDVAQDEEHLTLSLVEPEARGAIASVVELQLSREAFAIAPMDVIHRSMSVAYGKAASASNVFGNKATYGADKAFDDDPATRWATDAAVSEAWLQVDLGTPQEVARAVLREAYAGRIKSFELQCRQGDTWHVLHKGTLVGDRLRVAFEPTTAQVFRVVITASTGGPTLWDVQLLEKP